MNEVHDNQLICVAIFDKTFGDDCERGLDVAVVPVGPGGWAGLLEAAKLQESDDEGCDGYFVMAKGIDSATSATMSEQCWDDLCQEQVARIYSYLVGCVPGPRVC